MTTTTTTLEWSHAYRFEYDVARVAASPTPDSGPMTYTSVAQAYAAERFRYADAPSVNRDVMLRIAQTPLSSDHDTAQAAVAAIATSVPGATIDPNWCTARETVLACIVLVCAQQHTRYRRDVLRFTGVAPAWSHNYVCALSRVRLNLLTCDKYIPDYAHTLCAPMRFLFDYVPQQQQPLTSKTYGTLYAAYDRRTKQPVAIKMIRLQAAWFHARESDRESDTAGVASAPTSNDDDDDDDDDSNSMRDVSDIVANDDDDDDDELMPVPADDVIKTCDVGAAVATTTAAAAAAAASSASGAIITAAVVESCQEPANDEHYPIDSRTCTLTVDHPHNWNTATAQSRAFDRNVHRRFADDASSCGDIGDDDGDGGDVDYDDDDENNRYDAQYTFARQVAREIIAHTALRHACVVQTTTCVFDTRRARLFIVMNRYAQSLAQCLRTASPKTLPTPTPKPSELPPPSPVLFTGPARSVDVIRAWLRQLLEGVCAMHANGILHCDLTPGNVLLDARAQRLVVCDFSLVQFTEVETETETTPTTDKKRPVAYNRTGHELVTLWTRAPECLFDARDLTCGVDVWACGNLFYAMWTNELPFMSRVHDAKHQWTTITRHRGFTACDRVHRGVNAITSVREPDVALGETRAPTHRFSGPFGKHADAWDLLTRMLTYDSRTRITPADALRHPFLAVGGAPDGAVVVATASIDATSTSSDEFRIDCHF
jgi:serine/threonine protein kinase